MLELDKHSGEIGQLCSKYKVKTLYAFGSMLTNKFNNDSDIDFIVEFEPLDIYNYADNYYDLKFSLEKTFHRPIDLLEEQALKNPYFKEAVNNKRKLIYEH